MKSVKTAEMVRLPSERPFVCRDRTRLLLLLLLLTAGQEVLTTSAWRASLQLPQPTDGPSSTIRYRKRGHASPLLPQRRSVLLLPPLVPAQPQREEVPGEDLASLCSPGWSCCRWHRSGAAGSAEWRVDTGARRSYEWPRWTPWCWWSPGGRPSRPTGCHPGRRRMSTHATRPTDRDAEDPNERAYVFRHGDRDDLIGHRLNLREGREVIDRQLEGEDERKKKKTLKTKASSSSYRQWGHGRVKGSWSLWCILPQL